MTNTKTAVDLRTALESYLSAWNSPDAAERLSLLERSVTDDVAFVDPMKQTAGREALAAHIADVRATFPGIKFASRGEPDYHNNLARQPWVALKEEEVLLRGTDIDDVAPDGRLSRIVGFFDKR